MTQKLYSHKTDGGAEYLCLSPIEGDDEEGDLFTAFIRLDGGAEILRDSCEQELTSTLCDLLEWAKGNRGTKSGNPYTIPEVKDALTLLAKIQGVENYLDAKTSE